MTKLSVAIIARDNAGEIAKCLKSVKGADEIIVLDTGSKDNTPAIATANGAIVYYTRWENDFSAARNRALDYCHGDWILSLDTDETLYSGINSVRDAIEYYFKKRCLGVLVEDSEKSFYGQRLFRKAGVYWTRRIHEELNIRADLLIDTVKIWHEPSKNHHDDPDRNIRILREILEKHPLSALDMFYLGEELYRAEQYDSASYWLEYYVQSSGKTQNFTSEAYYLLGECYCKLHRSNKGVESMMKAIDANPEMKAAYVRLAQLTRNDKWTQLANVAKNTNTLVRR